MFLGYGVGYLEDDNPVLIRQIGGGGRLRLDNGERVWWSKNAKGIVWEVFQGTGADGHNYATRAEAAQVARNLNKANGSLKVSGDQNND